MSHTTACAKWRPLAHVWTPCDCYEPDTDWAPDQPCGGISVNGATPPLCEVHMKPWGHRRPRVMPPADHRADMTIADQKTDRSDR